MREIRASLYNGAIYRRSISKTSIKLTHSIRKILREVFRLPSSQLTTVKSSSTTQFNAKIALARSLVVSSPVVHELVSRIIFESGLSCNETILDPPYLRGISEPPENAENLIHRDTWLASPNSQINWWMALFETPSNKALGFFPSYFNKYVKNTSCAYDHAAACEMAKRGFITGQPHSVEKLPLSELVSTDMEAGELLIFSSAHLHGPMPSSNEIIRFSVDFRTVDVADEKNRIGAPSVDNQSKGNRLNDYLRLAKISTSACLCAPDITELSIYPTKSTME